jgi:penicillin-binding protein 1C
MTGSKEEFEDAEAGAAEPSPLRHRLGILDVIRRALGRRLKMARPAALQLAAFLSGVLLADTLFPPPIPKAQEQSRLVLDREGRWVHAFTTDEGRWRFPADLDAIDREFIERLIAVEDKRFYAHAGVDPAALARALKDAALTGEIASGASTITMQTARLLEPRKRTLVAKAIEMLRAVQIESRLSKRQILELYLTLAPYGGNIEGVRAASLTYFGHEPAHLSDAEQALLIALPQAPEARRPSRRPAAAQKAASAILARLEAARLIDPHKADEAREAGVPRIPFRFDRRAYHVAQGLAAASGEDAVIASTLDVRLQAALEETAAAHARALDDGATLALMVVDNRTRAVRAAIGSADLKAEGGWIDLTRAVRSPGSALKPIIYGLVFDDGLAGPDTVIDDMPQSFDGYAPENFDRTFRGEVSVAEALQHSLNVPAVTLLDRIGALKLSAMLEAAGVHLKGPKRADSAFGLTLALGGAGVTMRDLATLYSGLANGGDVAPLVWRQEEEGRAGGSFRMFSGSSARRITEILTEAPALDGRAPSVLSKSAPRVAMKTGTSYGYRDAWAAGYAGAYTAVVWVGRADGAPRPGETGRKAAAPILFDVFDVIARFDPEAPLNSGEAVEDDDIAVARLVAPRRKSPPEIVFPRDGVEVFAAEDGRPFQLAARGGAGGYTWYVSGVRAETEPTTGKALWRPEAPGFYDILVVDRDGRASRAKVRVAS